MAHILKYPTLDNKGVIFFTHKEISYFSKAVKSIRYSNINRITAKIFPKESYQSFFHKELKELHKHYFFGEHFGWYHRDYQTMPLIDFYLATESTVSFKNEEEIFRIPLSSSSFINESFQKKNYSKVWDIICVSHNGNNKRLQSLFKSIRKLFDEGKRYKILLINKASIYESKKGHFYDIESKYHELFSMEERQFFVLLRISASLNFLGLPTQAIADFYNSSKVFTLFSEQEGEPRAASEALLCGLPVVMNKNIKAGGVGLDNLDQTNSVLFENYDDAHLALIQAVENYDTFTVDSDSLKKELREDYTIEKLKEFLSKLYLSHNQEFDGVLDNGKFLANAVNAHITDVPWTRGRMKTADILSKEQFKCFAKEALSKLPRV